MNEEPFLFPVETMSGLVKKGISAVEDYKRLSCLREHLAAVECLRQRIAQVSKIPREYLQDKAH